MLNPEKHGRLTLVAATSAKTADGHILGRWLCDCGTYTAVAMSRVRNGYTNSCGCLVRDTASINNRRHGMRGSREYSSWQAMKRRCLDPSAKDYPRWGGKGVTICDEWATSFEAFFAEVGPRPPGTTLDRTDNRRGYEPGNVRWATHREQQSNRADSWTVDIAGIIYGSVQAAARANGVSDATITRWCDGYVDARRPHLGKINSKPNCRRWRTYA